MQRAEHRHVGVVLDHRAQLGLVARAAEAVQDHAADANAAVEGLVAEDQRRDAARHAARVDHEQNRQAEPRRERRVAVAAVERQAVVQALVAFDERKFGVGGVGGGARARRPPSGGVEVQARPAGGGVSHIGSM